jgi:hypothetical protein
VEELFDESDTETNFFIRFYQVVPEIGVILTRLFSVTNNARTFINTRLLPLISSTIQLNESPVMWLLNRLHTIVEQRQKTPISRADLLQLMLQVTTNEAIHVSKIFRIQKVPFLNDHLLCRDE